MYERKDGRKQGWVGRAQHGYGTGSASPTASSRGHNDHSRVLMLDGSNQALVSLLYSVIARGYQGEGALVSKGE